MLRIALACVFVYLLSACGIKGPLYIPEKQYPQDQTAPAAQPPQKKTNE